ncbi:cas1p-like protein [Colletotrichum tabaci]|uniref:Cas1p-like protein n=1 Tax=Colletotrichum tabaci TaxID=1209068 RepID=A0AAV9SZX2_9PEZI
MHYKHIIVALVAFGSLAAAAPAQDSKAIDRGQGQSENQGQGRNNGKDSSGNNKNRGKKNNNSNNRNGDINVIQNIIKPNIIVVQENLDKVNRLQRQSERQLAALVQSQLALATQLQTVKDNIRINHFKAQFPQANTIIVTVTGLVDNRNQGQQNQRYLVNQLLADNGLPGKQALVMVTDPTPMQISTLKAASSQADAFGAARVELENPPAAGSNNSNFRAQAVGGGGDDDDTLKLATFSQQAPLGQIGQSIILPAGTQAPQLASVPDPAAIILPGQQGLFVQNAGTFLADCATSAAGGNAALAGQIFSSFEQLAAAQLAGLSGLGIFDGNRGNSTAQAPPSPAAQGQQPGGQNLGSIAVGANQEQPAAVQPPAQVATPPQAIVPPAQVQTDAGQSLGAIVVGANQEQPPATGSVPAPQPPAAVVDEANQAVSPVQIGENPGTAPPPENNGATQPQSAPAPVPPAAVVAGANQTKSAT